SRFYRFSEAFESTNQSLKATERASGYLARGELYQRRLEFHRALKDYQAAYELDRSPLSSINLAQLYQQIGRLEEARRYTEHALKQSDHSWMINYGTDLDRYKMELHTLLMKTYKGLLQELRSTPYPDVFSRLKGIYKAIQYTFLYHFHRLSASYYSLRTAEAYQKEGQTLDAQLQYFKALKSFSWRARPYLRSAMKIETAIIPEAYPSYLYELGTLESTPELLTEALERFDPLWERDMIADCYAELAHLYQNQGRTFRAWDAIERLYSLNRGALRQQGLKLPLSLVLLPGSEGEKPFSRSDLQELHKSLKGIGIEILTSEAQGSSRYILNLQPRPGHIRILLTDRVKGAQLVDRLVLLESFTKSELFRFSQTVQDLLFSE
ncbi:MAG: hypothetical protein SNJ56_04985, partial [Termitinemataceae bacterium]